MGAYAPVGFADDMLLDRIDSQVIAPTLAEMANRGAPYRGVLYVGLMIAPTGQASVVEFNCRFGDPETQVVLPVIDGDISEHLWRIASGENWSPSVSRIQAARAAVTTVLAAPGYPENPQKGGTITVPEDTLADTILFHAGTTVDGQGALRVSGGRVLCATGVGPDVQTALEASQRLAAAVEFEGKVLRTDIGWREIARAGAT